MKDPFQKDITNALLGEYKIHIEGDTWDFNSRTNKESKISAAKYFVKQLNQLIKMTDLRGRYNWRQMLRFIERG